MERRKFLGIFAAAPLIAVPWLAKSEPTAAREVLKLPEPIQAVRIHENQLIIGSGNRLYFYDFDLRGG